MFVKNFTAGPKWLPGCISTVWGPLSFDVELEDGRVVQRHIDHIRSTVSVPSTSEPSNSDMTIVEFPVALPSVSTETVDTSSSEQNPSTTPWRSTCTLGPLDRYTPCSNPPSPLKGEECSNCNLLLTLYGTKNSVCVLNCCFY